MWPREVQALPVALEPKFAELFAEQGSHLGVIFFSGNLRMLTCASTSRDVGGIVNSPPVACQSCSMHQAAVPTASGQYTLLPI